MSSLKKVSKDQFHAFIDNYPRDLSIEINESCTPPRLNYHDAAAGKGSRSIVATTYVYDDEPSSRSYVEPAKREYKISK